MLRKCFDNDGLSFFRRTNQEYRECRRTFVSVLLSGTPGQVAPFVPSAENGLFSRQVFYYMPGAREFRSQFEDKDDGLTAHYQALGKLFFDWYQLVETSGTYTLLLSNEQKDAFNVDQLLKMAEPLYEHAVHIVSMLKATVTTRRTISDQDIAYAWLPEKFTYAEFKHIVEEMDIPQSTYSNWLKRWKRKGILLFDKESATYFKPSK